MQPGNCEGPETNGQSSSNKKWFVMMMLVMVFGSTFSPPFDTFFLSHYITFTTSISPLFLSLSLALSYSHSSSLSHSLEASSSHIDTSRVEADTHKHPHTLSLTRTYVSSLPWTYKTFSLSRIYTLSPYTDSQKTHTRSLNTHTLFFPS